MLDFRSLCAEDKPLFDSYRKKDKTIASEAAFATLFIWNDYYGLKIAENGEYLFLRFEIKGKNPSYFFPIGNGNLLNAVNELKEYSTTRGEKLSFRLVSSENAAKLERLFPEEFDYLYERDSSDYVYMAKKLVSLSGKKLHAKRNHLNYFKDNYDYSYEEVKTKSVLSECADMAYRIVRNKTKNKNPFELGAMEKYFENYFRFSQSGIAIRVNGKIVAVTLGEKLTEDTVLVQVELADDSVRGAYQMVNKLFCEKLFPESKYINREEDMGLEGLRQAKQSYQPEFLVDKYSVREREDK